MKRGLSSLLALALLVGCTANEDSDAKIATGSASSSSAPATPVELEAAAPYQPLPGEPAPEAKRAASDVVQVLTTFDASPDPAPLVASRLAELGVPSQLVDQVRPLLVAGAASAGDIVYPQLGGLNAESASVMVVVRQRLLEGGSPRAVIRTIDVRLARAGQGWVVTSIESAGGTSPEDPPPPSTAAAPVLANPAVTLPDSARWDILAGGVDQRVLALLARLGADHRIDVTVIATGHPHDVFASGRVSNHTRGRAVDIWAVDGRPVVDQRDPAGPLATLARGLLADGVTELGGPWDLDGPGGASFTNSVHQDHLHVGFDR